MVTDDWTARAREWARDIDREYAAGLLRHAAGDGQLTGGELDDRLERALRAKTLGDLAALVGDLRAEVTPPPAVPHVRVGWIAALGVGVVVVLCLGMVLLRSPTSSSSGVSVGPPPPIPDPCTGVSADAVDLVRCTSPANPLAADGLSARASTRQKDLNLPGNLPVPRRAEFVRPGWVSASYNEDGRFQITRRWHLEYLVDASGLTPEHVAEVYRATVAPVTFGTLGEEEALVGGGQKLRWTGGPYPLTVSIAPDPKTGEQRVRLDVSVDEQTTIPRPDVAGEFRQQLKVQRTATVPGMMYESSKVTWTDATSCRLEQVWSATPDQVDQIGKQARDLDATIETKPEGGTRLVFQSVLRDCTTFQL